MTEAARLLAAYDEQLRPDAETPSAISVTQHGPLRLVILPGACGFVTYRDLGGADTDAIRRLTREALAFFCADPEISNVEWKTRGHDHAPGLYEALLATEFTPGEPESIVIGAAQGLAADVELPGGVSLRRVTHEADVRAMTAMQDEVFGDPVSAEAAEALLRRLSFGDGIELWVAQARGGS